MATIIDAHQHFWQLSQPFDFRWLDAPTHAPIRRDFLPMDLKPHLDALSVKQTIFVQTQHNLAENRWALALAQRYPFIAGVVGWIDLAAADCDAQVLEMKQYPRFVGARHITQDEPDDDFIVRANVLRGLKILEKHGLPFDLLFYVQHLRHVPALARHLPTLPMVIDHLAKPHIRAHQLDDWLPHLRRRPVSERVLQIIGHDHGGELATVDAGRFEALCASRGRRFWPRALHVRLGLAGLRTRRQLRTGL